MLIRGYYFCESELCDYEITRGDVEWGLSDAIVIHENQVVKLSCYDCGGIAPRVQVIEVYHCPNCAGRLSYIERAVTKDNAPEVMGGEYIQPIHSDSLALSPDQVAQHRKDFPNIEIDDQCRPVFTHKKIHEEYMDKCGIVKQTQKMSKSKNKIYSYPGSKCS